MKQETSFWLWTVVFLLYFSFSDGSLTLAAQHLQTPTRWAAVCTSTADLWSSDQHREESYYLDAAQEMLPCWFPWKLLSCTKTARLAGFIHIEILWSPTSVQTTDFHQPMSWIEIINRDKSTGLNSVSYSFRGRQHEGFNEEKKSQRSITTNRIRSFDVRTIRAANGANAVVVGCFQESWDRRTLPPWNIV